ncbi:MAG: DUF1501 domain-containing protein [Verrucomicrobium sp.]|nr:DUF1501 domain-containing protein [Verrucomicrobium sp.]
MSSPQPSRSEPTSNRRKFLGQAGCAALSSVSVLNTLLNLKMASTAAAQAAPADYRTLVCIFLQGGNDSFNWLVPRDSRHAIYSTSRDNLALPLSSLRALDQSGGDGQLYGVHPNCPGLQEMFNGLGGDSAKRRAAWVANVGTLIAPVTKAQYLAESMPLPRSLFSHSDQIDQWQTSVPQGMTQLTGWAGRAADVLHSTANGSSFSMNLSLAGNNVLQVGNQTTQFVVTEQGALTFTGSDVWDVNHYHRIKNAAHRSIIQQQYSSLVQESFTQLTRGSIELQEYFLQQFNSYSDSNVAAHFPSGNYLASQFRAAAKMIGLRQALGLHRQTIFLGFGGWDHHSELLTSQAPMLSMLDGALSGFQRALETMGLQDSVITFSSSDFSRTLRSNGRGSDHAWGANALVMGGPVQGGRIYGTFPDLTLDSNNDTGYGGRMIPTTSVDQFVGEMLRWFGVKAADMPYVLPNLGNFYNASSDSLPIGYLRSGTWT